MKISGTTLTGTKQNGVTVTVDIPQEIVDELQALLETVSTPGELLQYVNRAPAPRSQLLVR